MYIYDIDFITCELLTHKLTSLVNMKLWKPGGTWKV